MVDPQHRLIELYAAKFAAETISAEPPRLIRPTRGNLRFALSRCVKAPPEEMLELIRQEFKRTYGVRYVRLRIEFRE